MYHTSKTARVYFSSAILLTLIVLAGIIGFRALASNNKDDNRSTNEETISVKLKSQNTPAINLRPGRDLPTIYGSKDDSSDKLRAGENQPTALASADFNLDGFPDLVTGYSAPDGGIVTFHKSNPEAFSPQSEESFVGISEGRFPDPFLENAESFAIPAAPDFLVAGDFDRDGNMDVITATRGGDKIYLLSGTGRDGGFEAPREIALAGRVTALTAGEIDAPNNLADLAIGIEGDSGASLLVFEDAEKGVTASPLNYELSSPAISLEAGKLDDDLFADTAILTGDGVFILHGRKQRTGVETAKSIAARLEKINLPFAPQALAIGNFIWNRAGKTQLALLAEDGTVQIAKRGELDEHPFSVEETRLNRLRAIQEQQRGGAKETLKTWQRRISEDWTIDDGNSVNVAAPANRQNIAVPILIKANLSGQNTDDILFFDPEMREVKILSTQEQEKVNGEVVSFAGERSVYTMEAASEPTAMLSMKLNNFVRPGLVLLQKGKTEPSFVPSAPMATFTVDRNDDTNIAAAQVCSAAANDCSLRGAISKANAAAGADIITLPAGTYTLTAANTGGTNEDSNATGDLDILQDLTITGAGQATTVVQAGTTNANGIDKVFASNPICTSVVNTSFTGLTVKFGRNTQLNDANGDFSFTGGGLDWCNTGAGGTLTVTDSTFDSNSATTGPGGGIDLDTASTTSGTVTLTGVTISNNKSSNPLSGGIAVPGDGGGLAILGGVTYNVTINNSANNNSTITGNTAQTNTGGGIYFSQSNSSGSSLTVSGATVSNNSAFSAGGGIRFVGSAGGTTAFTLNQGSVVSGNTSGTGAGGVAQGGGIFVTPSAGSATITKSTIINNVLSGTATTNRGGAGIATGQGPVTVSYCRIVGNTGTATLGTGLNKDINSGTTTATENWWGCSTGPSAAPCDTAVLTSGSTGGLTTSPYIVLRHTASPSTVVVGQTSTLTASFLTDSANNALSLSNITVLLGLPITFNNPVKGTISGAQATIQPNGMATATFTANAAGAGSADAIVDNDVAAAGRTNRATLTINQAGTTTTLASSSNPSVFGQSVTFTATVNVTAPGAGTPTGTVTFRDNGVNIGSCAAQTVSANVATCTVSNLSVGSHPITAVYNGDTNFSASAASNTVTQVVGKAGTTATITNDTPDPSFVGQAYAVTVSLAINSPGAGTPTGTITVSDGTGATCTITLPATNCNLTSTTAGTKTLTATYNGDANFNASPASAGVPHTVIVPPDLTITKTHTGNFTRGQTGAQYTITVTNSGGSSTSGTVTVVDTLPAGLTATAISGTAWSCNLGTLTCMRSDALGTGASYAPITLTVNVAFNAQASVTNTATVSGGNETDTSNDTADDLTTLMAPTAASAEISGRVIRRTGEGLSLAQVTITDQSGNSRMTTTSPFGYFRFMNTEAGETYIISVASKRYYFTPQVVNVTGDLTDLIFMANN